MENKEALGYLITGEYFNVRIILAARDFVNYKGPKIANPQMGVTPEEGRQWSKEEDKLRDKLKKAVKEAEKWAQEQSGTLA